MRLQLRRGTAAQWAARNPILAEGELGVDTTTDTLRIGDGVTAWSGLPTLSVPADGLYLNAGQYVTPGGSRSTLAVVQDVEYACPFVVVTAGTILKLGAEVTVVGAAASILRIGIRANLSGAPGNILGQTSIAGDAVATAEGDVSIPVTPGLYYACARAEGGTPTVRTTSGPTGAGSSAPSLAQAMGATPNGGYITGALGTGPMGPTFTVSNRAGALPLIGFRS